MRNVFLTILATGLAAFAAAQSPNKLFDRAMKLQTCNIRINANDFTATTFMELEFYNPGMQEIEGLQNFQLRKGQVITGFQLMLDGQYRDGSIEEKWKATNVYNTIVGKRVDPAILKLEYDNNYSLHIYPVPPKGTRKVTITIQEILPVLKNELHYSLPFKSTDTCQHFSLSISVKSQEKKQLRTAGLIKDHFFSEHNKELQLQWDAKQLPVNQPIEFFIPLPVAAQSACTEREGKKYFAVRHHTSALSYAIHPADLTVFWDVSNSAGKRDVKKEKSFLQQLISYHRISSLTIIPFNYSIKDKAVFQLTGSPGRSWQQYVDNLQYGGATQLGCIDLAAVKSDMYLLFTDGVNTYGKRKPVLQEGLMYCVNSSKNFNLPALQEIAGSSGGRVIDLSKNSIYDAVTTTVNADNWLLEMKSASGKTITEQSFPMKASEYNFLNGTAGQLKDTLYLHFGSGNQVRYVDTIFLENGICNAEGLERINMLNNFSSYDNHNWESILEFGLREKVVTYNTAFIVLEKASDYVKYNIAPPKDLEDECKQMNFVKRDTRWERWKMKKASEYEIMNNVVNAYNASNKKMDVNAAMLTLDKEEFDKARLAVTETQQNTAPSTMSTIEGKVLGLIVTSQALQEVVVVGYGVTTRRNLTGSVAYINRRELGMATTVEQALQGKVAGVQIVNTSGSPGSVSSVIIRGIGSLNSNQPLFVLDGVPVNGNINQLVSTADIENITVLKDPSVTAIYGGRGANGVIVINTKRGSNYYYQYNRKYKLSNQDDVDYMVEWKNAATNEKMQVYEQLVQQYGEDPGFYLDMADLFFKLGSKETAMDVLMNAPEAANGSMEVNIAIAYILEGWGNYSEAAMIYEQLVKDYPLQLAMRRNLAWTYYQQGFYRQAINVLYDALQLNLGYQENTNVNLKITILRELNAIVQMHKADVDISFIPPGLIQPVKADLRIVLDCNTGYAGSIKINEPGGHSVTQSRERTKNGGMVMGDNNYYNYTPVEYQINNAGKGKYKINTYYYGSYYAGMPSYIRIVAFKNFGKKDQCISVENVVMNNQSGEIEIGEISWPTVEK
jgi:TonB-dependent SusC/RagA subfamily outer membrane receptor